MSVVADTLVDVYGKTGNWEAAVSVLDTLEQQVSHLTHPGGCT